jgi:multiple sugar transport system substrate-binding protein
MKRMLDRLSAASWIVLVLVLTGAAAHAGEMNWKRYQGETITFLSSNHPWANAVLKRQNEFADLTGIKLRVDTFQEAQMRQRLVTVLQSKSPEVDLFMSLKSREGLQFFNAGWYADLGPLLNDPSATSPAFDVKDFSPALVKGEEYGGKLTGLPLNIEGPVVYSRKDIFDRCKVVLPKTLAEIEEAAKKIKACDASVSPWVSRGLKSAAPYTFSVFLHNVGGQYISNGKSNLSSKTGQDALRLYSDLLKNYGPPGVVNYTFYQISALYREGKAAMAFEASNELGSMMEGGARLNDTSIMLLPPGPGGSHPTVIGWGLSLSAYSKKQGPAWYFMQWATSKDMQTKLALEGIAPPRASVGASAEYQRWVKEQRLRQEWVAALSEMAKTGTSEVGPPMEEQPAAREAIGDAINRIVLGQATVEQAAADADKAINQLLEKEKK